MCNQLGTVLTKSSKIKGITTSNDDLILDLNWCKYTLQRAPSSLRRDKRLFSNLIGIFLVFFYLFLFEIGKDLHQVSIYYFVTILMQLEITFT